MRLLFGKTLLEVFKAIHDYRLDKIVINVDKRMTVTLQNQAFTGSHQPAAEPEQPISIIADKPQDKDEQVSEIDLRVFQGNSNLFTRMTEPHKPERVEELL